MKTAEVVARHTPGPWYVADEGSTIRAQFEGEEVALLTMSHTRWSYPDGDKTVRLGEQSSANARLIAAAPELLEALKHAFNWCEGYARTSGFTPPWMQQAEAAIAKTEGQ